MDSIDYPPPPSQLICPQIRIQNIIDRPPEKNVRGIFHHIIDNSFYLSEGEDEKSSHLHHLNLLLWCNNKEDKQNDFVCLACELDKIGTIYYYCNGCETSYHKECVESPAVFISLYHPRYPLQLLRMYSWASHCHSCEKQLRGLVYYSSIYDIFLDPVCAKKEEFPTINNQKRHEHTLHFFPRKAFLICDVCGTDDYTICFYICHQCDFVVHKTCVDSPRVIQISRHRHRLLFTSFLSSKYSSCGVCRDNIDGNYGEYSCSKGCEYAVHCKCALRSEVWDGKELEDEPEKKYDNIKSYEEIDDGIIRHFSHPHHNMRFDEDIGKAYYKKKRCKACFLPLYDGNIYRCIQCDFVLHQACAILPRKIQNMVHAHKSILEPGNSKSYFRCDACYRYSCGFRYKCSEDCNELDVRCASLSEPLHHQSHPHPLFLPYTRISTICPLCGIFLHDMSFQLLSCVQCDFALCFRCATLPNKYKHEGDEHLLNLCYEKDAIFSYWCDVCEEKMDPKKGYYACSECGTTIHIQCILGNEPYMKPGQEIRVRGKTYDIIPNSRLTRPICNYCQRHCQGNILFIRTDGMILCSEYEFGPAEFPFKHGLFTRFLAMG